VVVACVKGTAPSIALGTGSHASGSTRRMIGGTNGEFLSYELYQPSASTPAAVCTFPGTQVWGTTGGAIFTPTGVTWDAGTAQSFNVCGTIAAGQNVSADPSYTDTVVATVNF
jgi:spore coat protein U-like protein